MNLRKLSIFGLMLPAAAALLLMQGCGGRASSRASSQTTIVSPTNGESVSSPFTLNMRADSCSSKPVAKVGYSLDNSTDTPVFNDSYMDGPVNAPSGWHTLHVKVWDVYGDICVTDVSIHVSGGDATSGGGSGGGNTTSGGGSGDGNAASAGGSGGGNAASGGGSGALSVVPSDATEVSSIQTLDWSVIHDGGTSGSSDGTTYVTDSPSITGSARLFANVLDDFGGERYSSQFSDDTGAENFVYDTQVYIANDSNGFNNLEFDLNQTMSNGETVIMGFQCDTWTKTWDYTVNGGSPDSPWDTWQHSSSYCNLHDWSPNQWHHVQIYFSHDQSGWVTYHSVWLDGNQEDLNLTVFSGFNLGWAPAINTQFQIDGNSDSTTWGNVYLDQLKVYRW